MVAGQFPRLEDEGSEESSPQVVGLADGGGVSEGMHPRLYVPRRRIAGYGRGHQKPQQAAKNGDGRDDEWRIEEVIAATRVGDVASSYHLESDYNQDREIESGRDTP
ncbi:MAG: hypothetical protein K0R44_3445 [Thermomicrobiales bacterium]|nr:hypothetical protein [Thermomicrobiales bacterium]